VISGTELVEKAMSHSMKRRRALGAAVLATSISLSLFAANTACADRGARTTQSRVAARQGQTTPQSSEPQRVYMGWGVLSIPSYFTAVDGKYDLILHFHGGVQLQEENIIEHAHMNAIVVSVNLGVGSGPYSDFYAAPGSLKTTLERTQTALEETGRAPGAKLGRLALSAWSAGFGAVGAILSERENMKVIDTVLLADGLHAAYLGYPGNYHIYTASLEKFATFANAAMRGEKLFAITHSSIQTDGYASTTETVGELLRVTACPKTMHKAEGPGGMRELYEFDRGNFHVKGFEGTREQDHIDHIKEMHETLFPYLKARWAR
jgi:hypothetical protein